MSHSDLCGRCHQQRRVHIDTVAGLLCPTARFLAEVRELRAPPEASPATARELGSDLCVECKHPIHWHAPSRPGCKGPKPCACGLTRGEAHGRAAAPAPASPAAPRGEPLDAILARCQTVGERAMALTAWDAARASPAPRAPGDTTRKEE